MSILINALIVVWFIYCSALAVIELVVNLTSKRQSLSVSAEVVAALPAGCCFGLGKAAGTEPGVMLFMQAGTD